jgi:chemotaxis protein MotA
MLSFLKGMSPTLAVEVGRRAVPEHVRPSFKEVEQACRQRDDAAATEPAGTPAAATA